LEESVILFKLKYRNLILTAKQDKSVSFLRRDQLEDLNDLWSSYFT